MANESAASPKTPRALSRTTICPPARMGTWFAETIKASGFMPRVNRPNTRPHLTKCRSPQKKSCYAGDIHTGQSRPSYAVIGWERRHLYHRPHRTKLIAVQRKKPPFTRPAAKSGVGTTAVRTNRTFDKRTRPALRSRSERFPKLRNAFAKPTYINIGINRMKSFDIISHI